jgi:UDP-2,4-diacetamido-2,4,6-trideoxy-beta-L-altropyranose hydrolase
MGHAMRCLAVAQAWRRGGAPCLWAGVQTPDELAGRLRDDGIETVSIDAAPGSVEDARALAEVASRSRAGWALVDGYRFEAAYQDVLAEAEVPAAWIDDCGLPGRFRVDLVVNPNAVARREWYDRREPRTQLLLGPRYVPLRREFAAAARAPSPAGAGLRLLVTLGGADPENATLAVMRAVEKAAIPGSRTRVVGGPANPHVASLRAAAGPGVEIVERVTDMAAALRDADLAVTGAGGTVWEALHLGVPTLTVVVAEDQRGNGAELDRLGVARLLGEGSAFVETDAAAEIRALAADGDRRQAMAARGRALVDGRGAARIVAAMRATEVTLRRVRAEDRDLLFRWANDPEARRASFSLRAIPWDEHVRWWEAKLADPTFVSYVAAAGGEPLGTVRFQGEAATAVMSVTVDVAWRGRGYGGALIRAACLAYLGASSTESILAFVKEDNVASRQAFLAAGFREDGPCPAPGSPAQRLALNRGEALS